MQIEEMLLSESFVPFRRNIRYTLCKEVKIGGLLEQLSFTRGKRSWGYLFRLGHFEISREDFLTVARAMLEERNELTI